MYGYVLLVKVRREEITKNLATYIYMTGGLMQLVAYGAQDIYLTGQPAITYFKVVYRRHTNFAMESIQQVCNGRANFGNTINTLISRNGDLIRGIMVEVTLPGLDGYRWTDDIGHYIIKSVNLQIGGQIIDRHYADWLEIWSQLTVPAGQRPGYLHMIGQDAKDSLGQPTGLQLADSPNATAGRKVYVPLQFWFCRNVGLALPLIALQYHEVQLELTLETLRNLSMDQDGNHNTEFTELPDLSIWVDYIYLDTDERRRFAQVSHEYLIEQLQYSESNINSSSANVDLNFNHPVKELIWVCRPTANSTANQWNNYTTTVADTSVLPIVNIVPAMNLRTTAAGKDIWAVPYNGWPPGTVGGPVNTLTNPQYTSSMTHIPHKHNVHVDQYTETANVAHTHTYGGVTSRELGAPWDHTHSYSGTTGGMSDNEPHRHSMIFDVSTNIIDPMGGHVHGYYVPYLRTDGSPITSMFYSADYGNGHFPDLSVNNHMSSFETHGSNWHLTYDTPAVTLASVTSAHDFLAGGQLKSDALNPVTAAKLVLNGQDRFSTRDGPHFNLCQTAAHTNKPESKGINVYSFAIKPEDHQPSGTCNFSRIDNARLVLQLGISNGIIKVYATNYNVLRIMSGMGGLAYSN